MLTAVTVLEEILESQQRAKAELPAERAEAVAVYLAARKRGNQDDAFGLWGPKGTDGVAYQRKIRGEW